MLSYCHKFSKYTSGTCVIVASRKVILSLMFLLPQEFLVRSVGSMKIPIGMELGHMTYSALFQLFVFSENFITQIRGTCQSLFFSLPCKKEHFSGYCLRRGMRLYSVPLPSQGRLMIFQGIHLCLCFSCFKTTTLFLIRILGKGLHFEHNLLIHVAQSFTTYFLEVFTEHR